MEKMYCNQLVDTSHKWNTSFRQVIDSKQYTLPAKPTLPWFVLYVKLLHFFPALIPLASIIRLISSAVAFCSATPSDVSEDKLPKSIQHLMILAYEKIQSNSLYTRILPIVYLCSCLRRLQRLCFNVLPLCVVVLYPIP